MRLWPSIPDESIGLPVELETRLDFYPMLSFRCELCQSLLVVSTAIRHAQFNWRYSLEIHFRSIGNRKLIHTQLSRRNASIRSNSRRLLVTNVSPSPLA